jgi:SPX domain protein involved in polyphosphate accumulation
MVNFGTNFRQSMHGNWLQYYVDYSKLKSLITKRTPPSLFEDVLMWEVQRCNTFLVQRAQRISHHLAYLKTLQEDRDERQISSLDEELTCKLVQSKQSTAARKSRKRALVELYRFAFEYEVAILTCRYTGN